MEIGLFGEPVFGNFKRLRVPHFKIFLPGIPGLVS